MADQLLSDLFAAYYDARKNKRKSAHALAFELEYEKNIFALYRDLKNRAYTVGKSEAFIVFDPVQREIIASPFRDRVVHHLIFNYINPIFEKTFITDSYSCRTGKGTGYGIQRVSHFIRSCSRGYSERCFILKLDVSGYFMSISQEILYEKIETQIRKSGTPRSFNTDLILELLRKIIFHDYTDECVLKGNLRDWDGLPRNKSLFHAPSGYGLPIGNLTSQLFSNIYLNGFDHFVKRELRCRYYGRYVDDFVLIDRDKRYLQECVPRIRDHLSSLRLQLHPNKKYLQPYDHGVAFLGVIIKPYRTYIHHKTKNNLFLRIRSVNALLKRGCVNKVILQKILAGMNSYLGLMIHHRTYNLRKKMLSRCMPDFWRFFLRGKSGDEYGKIFLKRTRA